MPITDEIKAIGPALSVEHQRNLETNIGREHPSGTFDRCAVGVAQPYAGDGSYIDQPPTVRHPAEAVADKCSVVTISETVLQD